MKEQFDKKLVEKIKDSFSHHEEPFDSRQWEKLSAAYFKPTKSVWQLYWPYITTGIAASLLLVLFFSPLGMNWESGNTASNDVPAIPVPDTIPDDLYSMDSSIALRDKKAPAKSKLKIEHIPESLSSPQQPRDGMAKNEAKSGGEIPPVLNQQQLDPANVQQIPMELPELAIGENLSEKASKDPATQATTPMDQSEALDKVNEWLAENGSILPVTPKKERAGPLKLGVMVSPQANSNATGGMNLGAGVMSEFSLTRRLKLDVGVNYARQSMVPDRAPNMVMEMASYSNSRQQMDTKSIMTSSNFIGSEMQLNFASLDIPVNLKYRVLDRKNAGLFLITGLSSVVYLDQQATETFQTSSFFTSSDLGLSFAPSVQNYTSVYTPEGGGNSVDVGGMLNLSIGYEYNLSDGMFISLEPFYKLPLGNLTFANQQFSIGGMNLRMNFKVGK
ncbi:outer membrane beta-barrel protein [Lunatibacter salilacus]|uniref:outer membrane beta-barrel protein n=1 Tax=Lunatibacter salilacus TaxID=2483804 RepID=UPI00131D4488|nr:outer membrane beta-barrel protein [Lunatibacter salilacus]